MKPFVVYCHLEKGGKSLNSDSLIPYAKAYADDKGSIEKTFLESEAVEVGTSPKLAEAIDLAKKNRCTLLVENFCQHYKDARFLERLRDAITLAQMKIVAPEMPEIELTSNAIEMLARLLETDRARRRQRTKDAHSKLRASGKQIGREKGCDLSEARAAAKAVRKSQADAFAESFKSMIQQYRSRNRSYAWIADKLNRQGFETARGKSFTATTVRRLEKRCER